MSNWTTESTLSIREPQQFAHQAMTYVDLNIYMVFVGADVDLVDILPSELPPFSVAILSYQ